MAKGSSGANGTTNAGAKFKGKATRWGGGGNAVNTQKGKNALGTGKS